MERNDMDVIEFARKTSMLTTDTPLSKSYDESFGQKKDRWWSSQREHLTVWCLFYPTEGVNGFQHQPSNSASKMYYQLRRPEILLWLIEALITEKKIRFDLESLIDEIRKDTRAASACKKIRETVPFGTIMDWLAEPKKP